MFVIIPSWFVINVKINSQGRDFKLFLCARVWARVYVRAFCLCLYVKATDEAFGHRFL